VEQLAQDPPDDRAEQEADPVSLAAVIQPIRARLEDLLTPLQAGVLHDLFSGMPHAGIARKRGCTRKNLRTALASIAKKARGLLHKGGSSPPHRG
jgi:DNA-directed RNA polymerase specialized sigma24 family protein